MNCVELKGFVYEYLERQLAPERRAEIEHHAATCVACGDFLRVARELTCRELVEFLDDYVDGRLPPPRRAVFERHLGLCPPCVDYVESYQQAITVFGEACSPCEEPAEIPEDLIRAILAARTGPPGLEA